MPPDPGRAIGTLELRVLDCLETIVRDDRVFATGTAPKLTCHDLAGGDPDVHGNIVAGLGAITGMAACICLAA
jgi:hypothetical protein